MVIGVPSWRQVVRDKQCHSRYVDPMASVEQVIETAERVAGAYGAKASILEAGGRITVGIGNKTWTEHVDDASALVDQLNADLAKEIANAKAVVAHLEAALPAEEPKKKPKKAED